MTPQPPISKKDDETVSPQRIADALSIFKHRQRFGVSSTEKPRMTVLTEQQTAIIRASTQGAALVTAGAGSGKTETMTMRILWLVANGHARLDEILGMTFTRRAATALSQRLTDGIEALRAAAILPAQDDSTEALFSSSITTYNAFANRVFGDFAHLIGEDGGAAVMTEATAFNLARDIVLAAPKDLMAPIDAGLNDIIEAVLSVSRSLTDNMTDPAALVAFARAFHAHVEPLPLSLEKTSKRNNRDSYVRGLRASTELMVFAQLAENYAQAKRERRLIEFSDQIAYAHQLSQIPAVRETLARNIRFVLLDEYQDTSSVQVAFLSRMFAGTCVMAVGDPNQAIYAWRGASASNMRAERFFAAFGTSGAHDDSVTQRDGEEFWLSTSWRNPSLILDCANSVIEPLTTVRPDGSSFALRPGVTHDGTVTAIYPETIADEANAVAQWFGEQMAVWPDSAPPTAAVLARKNADLLHMKAALEGRGLRTHVLGLGGLLMEPVIVDIVCTLRVVHLANSDSELIRLLSGARWMIAPRDLRALHATAVWLGERDHDFSELSREVSDRLWESVSASDGYSLVDALDYVATTASPDPRAIGRLSAEGLERLREAGLAFGRLRRLVGMDLRELVRLVMTEMRLDIELAANDDISVRYATGTIQTFLDTVASFVATSDNPTLGSLLVWLEEVERRERLSTVQEDPEPGVVQLLTVHGAKGLEWDLVALTRMSAPAKGQEKAQVERWTNRGVLPEQLRADKDDLGTLWQFEQAHDQVQLEELFADYFDSAVARHLDSERRLTYVGITRAAHHLLLSGSWWSTGKTLRLPNEYLADLCNRGLASPALPQASEFDKNPWDPKAEKVTWPLSPLGRRHNRVTLAAAWVSQAIAHSGETTPAPQPIVGDNTETPLGRMGVDVDLLLAEREARSRRPRPRLAQRVPASQFKDFVATSSTSGMHVEATSSDTFDSAVGRAMPQRPYRATMLGTLFHAWVESRSLPEGSTTLFDLDDNEDVTAFDVVDGSEPRRLEDLKRTFESSPWGLRRPFDVETEIHLPLGPNIIVCKLDAIFVDGKGDSARYEIVDWKTGTPPSTPADVEARMYQLALYRVAFSQLAGVPVDRIEACLYYVADDYVLRPDYLPDYAELETLWLGVMEANP